MKNTNTILCKITLSLRATAKLTVAASSEATKQAHIIQFSLLSMIFGGFVAVFGQAGPPSLPAPPQPVPWENTLLIALGYLGYGMYRIVRRKL